VRRGLSRRRNVANPSFDWNAVFRYLEMREQIFSVSAADIVEISFCSGFSAKSFRNEHFLGRDTGSDADAIGTYDDVHCALRDGMCNRCEHAKLEHSKTPKKILRHQR